MRRTTKQRREDILRIWAAGVAAVRSPRLVFDAAEVDGYSLRVGEHLYDLHGIDRIAVVGGGKAAAGMALALEQALGPAVIKQKRLSGIVNVPADCLVATDAIQLHPGRPAEVNEAASSGVDGVRQMMNLVAQLSPRDLCIGLLSGGGSALLPLPIDGFSLTEKIELTRAMSAAGATIDQLNTVRRELSVVKGGGLARACRAGSLVTLIISDVLGDDLSLIASGPTVMRRPTPQRAIEVLRSLNLPHCPAAGRAIEVLRKAVQLESREDAIIESPEGRSPRNEHGCRIVNHLLANNATAVDAAGVEAERLGYSHAMISANASEGPAEEVARQLVAMAIRMRESDGPDCLISGGEPTVRLAPPEVRGRGGRNQQLCLSALAELPDWRGLALISGGTDGEDGPTNAAGACVDERIANNAARLKLDPQSYLGRNDAYSFFKQTGGLLKTGPTNTNVCDLRVITVSR